MFKKKPRRIRSLICLLAAITLLCASLPAFASQQLPIQDCHKVTLTKADTTQSNKSVIRVWTAETVLDSVNNELADIEQNYVESIGSELKAAANKTSKNSRLDVELRYSRTGLTWMSFLIQARVTYHRALVGQEITSRTYDMMTGERIYLTDIFDEDSMGWDILADAVRTQVSAYFPNEDVDETLLDDLCSRESLEKADFTLHGMSLVIHYPAAIMYPDHPTLLEITIMYPEIRDYMTDKAITETDNLTYYNTCALTFDDGPVRTNSTLVLNALMEHGARATFFVIGNRIKSYTDLVQKEHDNGCAIAMHNWHHGNVSKSKASALRAMPKKCNDALVKAIGIPARYDRVPYGLYPAMIKAKVGWSYIQWSLDTYDWRGRPSKTVLATVQKQISDGDIILCHDIKDNTPASTSMIIEYLEKEGYMLLTIDELFAKDGVTLKPDTVYYRCVDGDTSKKD